MAWIQTISEQEATGELKREYEAAVGRAEKVYNVLKIMSLNPGDASPLDRALQGAHAPPLPASPCRQGDAGRSWCPPQTNATIESWPTQRICVRLRRTPGWPNSSGPIGGMRPWRIKRPVCSNTPRKLHEILHPAPNRKSKIFGEQAFRALKFTMPFR